jgi:hypothetical protein|nr:MAG: hypothetical protein [Bacteriophage sp.]DAV66738.1 MAG TPA: hypothetical protein [Caudoviricetes sp.]
MARKKKTYSVKLDIGKKMPPLYHTLPGQDFWYSDSEVLKWIANQPILLNWVKDQLKTAGYITYDRETGKWTGIDYQGEVAKND